MSLLPMLYSNWWEHLEHPHTLTDQHFGHGICPDMLSIDSPRRNSPFFNSKIPMNMMIAKFPPMGMYTRPWTDLARQGQGGASTIKADKDKFQVSLDVQQFTPEEINVKVVDRTVIVDGRHEEKPDEHGWISRQFSRRYIVPEQCDIDRLVSKLSSDGVLSIVVPRNDVPKLENERSIKIEHTGKPAIRESGDAKPEKIPAQKEVEKK